MEKSLTPTKRPWEWSTKKVDAARLIAEDEISDNKIAAKLSISTRTIWMWKQVPEFTTRVAQIRQAYFASVMNSGIAVKENRVAFLKNLHQRQRIIIDARAEKLKDKALGGESGFIVIEDRKTGIGEDAEWVQDEVFDAAFHREVRATLTQAAEETGQLSSKHEITGANGGPIQLSVGVFDDIAARVRQARERNGAESAPGRAATIERLPDGSDGE